MRDLIQAIHQTHIHVDIERETPDITPDHTKLPVKTDILANMTGSKMAISVMKLLTTAPMSFYVISQASVINSDHGVTWISYSGVSHHFCHQRELFNVFEPLNDQNMSVAVTG